MFLNIFIVLSLLLLVNAEDKNDDCSEVDIDYQGMDYFSYEKINNALTCAQLCADRDPCQAWTWLAKPVNGQPAETCWLKDAIPKASHLVGVVSGKKVCSDENVLQIIKENHDGVKSEDCSEIDVDYQGMDYLKFEKIQNASACANLCSNRDPCQAWTWLAKPVNGQPAERCWLKNAIPNASHLVGVVSGKKICSDEKVLQIIKENHDGAENEDCSEIDVDYQGMDYLKFEKIQNASACAKLCSDRDPCKAWTWLAKPVNGQPAERCWLKNAIPKASHLVGVVSGKKSCSATQNLARISFQEILAHRNHSENLLQNIKESVNLLLKKSEHMNMQFPDCYEVGFDYLGNDLIQHLDVSSAFACWHLCKENASCQSWTYTTKTIYIHMPVIVPTKMCFLKNGIPEHSILDGVISGPRDCKK